MSVVSLFFAIASSGDNHVATELGSAGALSTRASLVRAEGRNGAPEQAELLVRTGDAAAVGSVSRIAVCQVINAPTTVCDPPLPPVAVPPAAVQAQAVSAAAPSASASSALAFTGSVPVLGELAVGATITLFGLLLILGTGAARFRQARVRAR